MYCKDHYRILVFFYHCCLGVGGASSWRVLEVAVFLDLGFFFLNCKLMFGFKQISCSISVIQFSVTVAVVLSSVNVKHSLYIKLQ